jgi:DNA recombination protein RmuC
MEVILLVGLAILLAIGIAVGLLWRLVRSPLPKEIEKRLEKREEERLLALKEEWAKRLGEELSRMWELVQGQIRTAESSVSERLGQANVTLATLSRELGRLQEATRKVEEVGRDVASLQDLLRAPKLRGGLGEYLLADLLQQVLPLDCYAFQYEFSDGQRVDAVIRLCGKLLPIDAKFPLARFQQMKEAATESERQEVRRQLLKDVRHHMDAIAQKYIRPSEGTFDFAFMYVPAENVYYEAILRTESNEDGPSVFQHAIEQRVIPVSPNSFYAYLQVILLGLRGLMVERRAQEILGALQRLKGDLEDVRDSFELAGKQLRNATANFEKAERFLGRFEDRLNAVEALDRRPDAEVVRSVETGLSYEEDA